MTQAPTRITIEVHQPDSDSAGGAPFVRVVPEAPSSRHRAAEPREDVPARRRLRSRRVPVPRRRGLRRRPRERLRVDASHDRHSRGDADRGPSGPVELAPTPLLPDGFEVPASRWTHPATRFRELMRTEPYLFGPGVYDPMGAQLVMYHGYKAVYFSGYSFAIGHLGTTDMDLYSGPEIADGARRTVSALRKFQLTQAVGDPVEGHRSAHLEIPPVVVDMDAGYGNIFNVQRQTELLVTAGVAAAHLEDQVLPKRCGHIGGKALVPAHRDGRQAADDAGRRRRPRARGLHGHRPDGRAVGDRRARARARSRARDRAGLSLPRHGHPRPRLVRVPDVRPRAGRDLRRRGPQALPRRRGSRSTGRRRSSGSSTPTR